MLLFGDNYQLFPVIDEGAIQGYSWMNDKSQKTPTTRLTSTQLPSQRGTYIFTKIMSETVFALDKNFMVKNNEFCDLLGRLRIDEPMRKDAEKLSNLHLIYYDEGFKSYLKTTKKPCGCLPKMLTKN